MSETRNILREDRPLSSSNPDELTALSMISVDASALNYKTKLTMHNFTVYNLCYNICSVWHEGSDFL